MLSDDRSSPREDKCSDSADARQVSGSSEVQRQSGGCSACRPASCCLPGPESRLPETKALSTCVVRPVGTCLATGEEGEQLIGNLTSRGQGHPQPATSSGSFSHERHPHFLCGFLELHTQGRAPNAEGQRDPEGALAHKEGTLTSGVVWSIEKRETELSQGRRHFRVTLVRPSGAHQGSLKGRRGACMVAAPTETGPAGAQLLCPPPGEWWPATRMT